MNKIEDYKIVIHIPNSYGVEIMVSNLAVGLSRKGYAVVAEIDREKLSDKAYQLLQSNSIETVSLGLGAKSIKSLVNLVKYVVVRKPKVIISSLFRCDLYCLLLKLFWRGKIITIFQGNIFEDYKHQGFYLIALYLNAISIRFSKLITISNYIRNDIVKALPWFYRKKVMTIYNGIDASEFYPIQTEKKSRFWKVCPFDYVVGLVGRLDKEKRPESLFRLADILEKITGGRYSFLFVLIGDGRERADLERYAAEQGYLNRFFFSGFMSDMNPAYNNLDFLVHFRTDEGFGLVITEAMACEVVPLAIRGSGVNEIIDHGVDGFLVDTLEEMALLIKSLAESPQSLRLIGKTARRSISEKFTLEQQVQKYCAVISDLAPTV